MNSLLKCLLIASLCANSGCITGQVLREAQPKEKYNSETKRTETIPGHDAYYALLPLSIPADIATSPLQLLGAAFVAVLFATGGGHGRPFRLRGKIVIADAEARDDWSSELRFSAHNLNDIMRRNLADAWLRVASVEHASIAAFSKMSLQLLALGAPADLLSACQQAALDEIDHARRCYALAGSYGNQAFGPSPITELNGVTLEKITLEQLAMESLQDGCLMEGFSAAYLHEAALRAVDSELKATLMAMSKDETRHAELAWNILSWSLRSADAQMRNNLRTALSNLPEKIKDGNHEAMASATCNAYGFLSVDIQAELYGNTLSVVNNRTLELLALFDETSGVVNGLTENDITPDPRVVDNWVGFH